MTVPAVLLHSLAGLDVVPPFDAPWLVRAGVGVGVGWLGLVGWGWLWLVQGFRWDGGDDAGHCGWAGRAGSSFTKAQGWGCEASRHSALPTSKPRTSNLGSNLKPNTRPTSNQSRATIAGGDARRVLGPAVEQHGWVRGAACWGLRGAKGLADLQCRRRALVSDSCRLILACCTRLHIIALLNTLYSSTPQPQSQPQPITSHPIPSHQPPVGLTLRSLVYDPFIEGRLIRAETPKRAEHTTSLPPAPAAAGAANLPPPSAAAAAAAEPQDSHQPPQQQPLQQQQQLDPHSSSTGAAAPARPSRRRRFYGTLAVFVASGLAHELVLGYVLRPYVWGISSFFFVQVRMGVGADGRWCGWALAPMGVGADGRWCGWGLVRMGVGADGRWCCLV